MPIRYHTFRLVPRIIPAEVLQILELICKHENQIKYEPDFEFDWIRRGIVISANSKEGLGVLMEQFNHQIDRKKTSPGELFLVGKTLESDGRYKVPMGIILQDPATFGEMIGRSLVDLGVRGIKITDRMNDCLITVQLGMFTANVDFESFVREFPLPEYINLYDDGEREATDDELKLANDERKAKRKAAQKKNKTKGKKR